MLVGYVKVEVLHPSSSDGFRMTGGCGWCAKERAGCGEGEERFLSSQADPFTEVKGKKKIGLLRSK
jgi:hypothetical protein